MDGCLGRESNGRGEQTPRFALFCQSDRGTGVGEGLHETAMRTQEFGRKLGGGRGKPKNIRNSESLLWMDKDNSFLSLLNSENVIHAVSFVVNYKVNNT